MSKLVFICLFLTGFSAFGAQISCRTETSSFLIVSSDLKPESVVFIGEVQGEEIYDDIISFDSEPLKSFEVETVSFQYKKNTFKTFSGKTIAVFYVGEEMRFSIKSAEGVSYGICHTY